MEKNTKEEVIITKVHRNKKRLVHLERISLKNQTALTPRQLLCGDIRK